MDKECNGRGFCLRQSDEEKYQKRDWEMDVRIYWGKTGSGKTRKVYDEFGNNNIYNKMEGKWWDNYNGEICVLFDNFNPKNNYGLSFNYFKNLLDKYPMLVECKGSSCQFRSKTIIFTSNYDPKDWFPNEKYRDVFFSKVKTIINV